MSNPWRPIGTVPSDSGPYLLWVETEDGGEVMLLRRDAERCCWLYEGEPMHCAAFWMDPTHWMPLPSAPARES